MQAWAGFEPPFRRLGARESDVLTTAPRGHVISMCVLSSDALFLFESVFGDSGPGRFRTCAYFISCTNGSGALTTSTPHINVQFLL